VSSPPPPPPEGCNDSSGDPPKVRLNATALSDPDSLIISVSLTPASALTSAIPSASELPTTGLVDCGSTHCFIDTTFANDNNLTTYAMPPRRLHLIDGSSNTWITRAVDLTIRYPTGDTFIFTFLVTPLDSSAVLVFGYNWLRCFNLLIDWSGGRIDYFRNLPQNPSAPTSTSGHSASAQPPEENPPPSSPSDPIMDTPTSSPTKDTPPSVSFINAAAFARAAKLSGSLVFQLSLSDIDKISGRTSSTSAADPPIDLSHILEDYHEFSDVFSQEKANTLPPHRPYNLKIDLEDGAEPLLGRMYSLSQSETHSL